MKLKRLLAVLLVLVLMLSACSELSEAIDDTAIRTEAEALLTAFVRKDYAACRTLVSQDVSDAELEDILEAIHTEVKDLGSWEMTAVAWRRAMSEGKDVTTIQYLVSGEGGKYYLDVAKLADTQGLSGFQITEAEADAEATTPSGLVHRVFTVVGFLTMIFALWMAVDCARRKMRFKWLWLPLIVLGMIVLTLTMKDSDMSWRFNVGLYLGMTNLKTFAAGGFRATVYVPLAAIVYFFKRKDLTEKSVIENLPEEPVQTEGEEE